MLYTLHYLACLYISAGGVIYGRREVKRRLDVSTHTVRTTFARGACDLIAKARALNIDICASTQLELPSFECTVILRQCVASGLYRRTCYKTASQRIQHLSQFKICNQQCSLQLLTLVNNEIVFVYFKTNVLVRFSTI